MFVDLLFAVSFIAYAGGGGVRLGNGYRPSGFDFILSTAAAW